MVEKSKLSAIENQLKVAEAGLLHLSSKPI